MSMILDLALNHLQECPLLSNTLTQTLYFQPNICTFLLFPNVVDIAVVVVSGAAVTQLMLVVVELVVVGCWWWWYW